MEITQQQQNSKIEVVKKSVYQYIKNCINNYLFGNYNISEVRSNLYNNLVHYSQLGTEDLNSDTLATYFQELNFNIIEYCEEKYPVQSQYSIDFESETEKSNKDKQKAKQHSKTTPNTSILMKTTTKHLQTPEQGTSLRVSFIITLFPVSLAQTQTPNSSLNRFLRPEDFTSPRSPTRQQEPLQTTANEKNNSETPEEELINSENKEDKMTAYITKILKFNREDIETSSQEWLDQTAFKTAFLEQFIDNNTSIILQNCFRNIKQKFSESVMTYIGKFNKLLRQICQLKTNDYYSNTQILDQFIAGLKDKLIKKVCSHASENLNSAIQHAKRYKMAIEETNRTKLVNLAIGKTSSAAEKKIDQLTKNNRKDINHSKDKIKIILHHFLITSLRIAITVESLATKKEIAESYNETNKIGQSYYQPPLPAYYLPRSQYQTNPTAIPTTTHTTLSSTCLKIDSAKSIHTTKLIPTQPKPNHYYIQPSYLTIPEEQDFHHTVLSEDIFLFEFKANKSPFLLSNAVANEQKAITVIYIEAKVEGKPIHLILDSGSVRSIITYQLMQQLKRNIDQPAQTVIVTANDIKKIPVGEIDNFSFTIDGTTIPVKVLVMDAPQYQALIRNDWLQKANTNLNWET
ncbi:hypothetical protein G9A89_017593 [Geosiphon pyriformis]|nr:hypothetical protein G9A89_017593 [Geosiphon pyriformis]